MTTVDRVFVIITASAISLFFLLSSGLVIYTWAAFKRLVSKAEHAIDSVETVTSMVKQVGGKGFGSIFFKFIKQLIHFSRKG